MWGTRKEYCEREGCSIDTFKRRKKAGLIQWRFGASGRGGEAGKHIEVWVEDPKDSSELGVGSSELGVRSSEKTPEPKLKKISSKWQPTAGTMKIARGEPGCHVETTLRNGEPVPDEGRWTMDDEKMVRPEDREKRDWIPASAGMTDQNINGGASGPQLCSAPNLLGQIVVPSSQNLPAIYNDTKPININPKIEKIAYLRYAILQKFREELTKDNPNLPLFDNGNGKPPKTEAVRKFLEFYNSGLLLPTIYNDMGSISRSTLYSWDKTEKSGGVRALTPLYRGALRSKLTDYEKYILLNTLLHQNRLKIGTAIKFTKTFLAYKKIESPSSEATLRRYAEEFKKTKYDAWVEAREGAKALNDKVLPYAERDWRLLTVGEGLVADGHRLNFQVISPFTGKPCRATIVLFWDWKSSYPLGWEIMLEESVQCIGSALRNTILTLGKIPKWLLIDNGKAFKAKVFTSDLDLEDGIAYGMFATLGIHTHFSQAYNPQSKPLERFWGTFNNWFERLLPSYSGASIPDKPAYMLRNEKDAQARHNDWVPKIEEVQKMLLKWREFYIDQPSRGRDGMKPRDIFEAEKGPGVDPEKLEFLMLAKEIKTVHRNGVTFNGWNYFNEAMYGYKDKVIIRFSHADYSQLLVYMPLRKSYCIAKPIEPVHPMASESEFPKDQQAVKNISLLKTRVRRGTKNLLNLIETNKYIDWQDAAKRTPDISAVVETAESREPKAAIVLPFRNSPEPEISIEEEKPLRFNAAWERYEYHLKGGVYRGQDLDQKFIVDYRAGIIAPGEWQAIYGEKAVQGGER